MNTAGIMVLQSKIKRLDKVISKISSGSKMLRIHMGSKSELTAFLSIPTSRNKDQISGNRTVFQQV